MISSMFHGRRMFLQTSGYDFWVDNKLTHLFAAQHHFRQFGSVNSALAIIFLANYGISFDVRPKHVMADEREVSCDVHK